jgi:polyhydroxybutyrate depolymerase
MASPIRFTAVAGPLAVAAVLLALAGCEVAAPSHQAASAPPSAVPTGTSQHSLTIDHRDRTYRLYRPRSLPGQPVPLVLVLHGALGSGKQAETDYGWDAKADAGHFVVAYPDGYHRTWNAGGCCGPAQTADVDDVGFLTGLVRTVSGDLPVDPHRVYATGISNGGLMAYRLACRTTVFAAIGPDSATMLAPCDSPAPLSVIHVHGLADQSIPFQGGPSRSAQQVDWPPVQPVIDGWRSVDGCAAPSTTTDGPVTTATASCPAGRAVELVTIAGAGHQWPGGRPNTAGENLLGLDEPSTALNATATIWSFFAAHPKP